MASKKASKGGQGSIRKAPTGIGGLDEITFGGLPAGRPTLVCGGAGAGKTLLAAEFLFRGATEFDEPGVFMMFEENARELTDNVRSLGFDLDLLVKDGKIVIDAAGHPVVNPSKFKSAARKAIKAIGYEQAGFHWKTARIDVLLHGQSADIAVGVDETGNKDVGAGDQGIMFGYASRETPELLPAPIYYAHKILDVLTQARKEGTGPAPQGL